MFKFNCLFFARKNYKVLFNKLYPRLLKLVRSIYFFIVKFKISKIRKKTVNTVQNVTAVILNKEERKKFLRKKLKQNKFKLFFEFILFLSSVLLIGLHLFFQKINPNDFRRSIEISVKKELNLDLSINGNVKWTVFKIYPAIEINNIIIKNIKIGKYSYTIKLGSVKARISLFSLLNGINVISKIHLDDISLISDDKINFLKSNKSNVPGQLHIKNYNVDNTKNELSNSFQNIKFDIDEIFVRNTFVKLNIQNIKEEFKVNNLIIQHILDNHKIILNSNIIYKGQSIKLSIITSTLQHWLSGDSENIPLSIRLLGLDSIAEWNLILKNINKSFTYIGTFNIISHEPQKLLKLFLDDSFYIGKINLSMDIIGNKYFTSFRDIKLKTSNSDISGIIDLSFKDRFLINANLQSKLIDLPKIFWPNWQTNLEDDNSITPYVLHSPLTELNVFKNTPLLLNYIKKLNLNLLLSVDELKAMPQMPIKNIDIKFLLNDGKLSLNSLSAKYANGDVKITAIGIINDKNQLDASLAATADLINIGKIVDYTGYFDFVKSGNSQMRLFLNSVGSDLSELMSNLSGGFKIYSIDKIYLKEMSNYMTGEDLIISLVSLFTNSTVHEKSSEQQNKGYDSYIECFVGNGIIKDGVYESGLGLAIETDNLNIIVDGKVDLGKELINMKLITFPKSGIQFSGNTADMISISGNLAEPDIKLRLQGTVSSIAKTGVLSAAVAPMTGGLSIAAFGIGFVAKTVWDNITAPKNPCSIALTLPINKELSQNVYLNAYKTKKRYESELIKFKDIFRKHKRIFQNSLK